MRYARTGLAAEVRHRRRRPPRKQDLPCGRFPAPQHETFTWIDPPEAREYHGRPCVVEHDGYLHRVRLTARDPNPSGGPFTVEVKRWRPSTGNTVVIHTVSLGAGDSTTIDHGDLGNVEEGDHIHPNVTAVHGADGATMHLEFR